MQLHCIGFIFFHVLWHLDYTSLYCYVYLAQSQFPVQYT